MPDRHSKSGIFGAVTILLFKKIAQENGQKIYEHAHKVGKMGETNLEHE
jgi:hypothetical protein